MGKHEERLEEKKVKDMLLPSVPFPNEEKKEKEERRGGVYAGM